MSLVFFREKKSSWAEHIKQYPNCTEPGGILHSVDTEPLSGLGRIVSRKDGWIELVVSVTSYYGRDEEKEFPYVAKEYIQIKEDNFQIDGWMK